MAKEITFYQPIYSWTSEQFINALEEAKNEPVVIRLASDGGEPDYGFGMIAKIQEREKPTTITVDGKANSMAAFMLAYTDNNECLDVSTFIVHRAAYPSWFESDNTLFTAERRARLEAMNKNLRAALEAKCGDKFKAVTGKTYDEVFSMEGRIDVTLNPKQAKQLGLVSKINAITPSIKAEIESRHMAIAAFNLPVPTAEEPNEQIVKTQNNKMNIETLKAEHPALYAQVKAVGVAEEKDRVTAWLEFMDIDAKAVKEGITNDSQLTQRAMAEFTVKSITAKQTKAIEDENPAPVIPAAEPVAKTEKEKALASFENGLDAYLEIKPNGGK